MLASRLPLGACGADGTGGRVRNAGARPATTRGRSTPLPQPIARLRVPCGARTSTPRLSLPARRRSRAAPHCYRRRRADAEPPSRRRCRCRRCRCRRCRHCRRCAATAKEVGWCFEPLLAAVAHAQTVGGHGRRGREAGATRASRMAWRDAPAAVALNCSKAAAAGFTHRLHEVLGTLLDAAVAHQLEDRLLVRVLPIVVPACGQAGKVGVYPPAIWGKKQRRCA